MNNVLRRTLKGGVESVLSRCIGNTIGERMMAGRTLVLAYHNIVPDGTALVGDSSLHLPRSSFARQLDLLLERCQVVPLEQLPAAGGRRPRVAITFDDAYGGAVNLGVAELRQRGLPATIFVAPGLLGQSSLWWDEVAAGTSPAAFEAERARFLVEFQGDAARIREQSASRVTSLPWSRDLLRAATELELDRAAREPGITIGSHSWSHSNLSVIPDQQLAQELAQPLEWLERRYDSFIRWLAYPYGLYSRRVAEQARRVGYHGAFRVEGGWLPRNAGGATFDLPRLNVPRGLSQQGFALRLCGLFS